MKTGIYRQDDDIIDRLEAEIILNRPPILIPIKHLFTKGMYVREMSAPAGVLITSKIHKTEHPFTLSKGKIEVRNEYGEWVILSAPYTGITKPGTRRVAVVLEDCIWTTYHNYSTIKGNENSLTDEEKEVVVDRIERRIIQKRINKSLINAKKEIQCRG